MAKRKRQENNHESIEVKTPQKARDTFVSGLAERLAGWLIGDWLEDTCTTIRAGCSEEDFTRIRVALEAEFPPDGLEKLADEVLRTALEKSGREELSINETEAVLMASLSDEYIQSVLSRRIESLLTSAPVTETAGGNDWQKKAEEYLNLARTVQAEFENYKKITKRENEKFRAMATGLLVKSLLPVMDALDQALTRAEKEVPGGEDARGFAQIRKLLYGVLLKEGLEEIPAAGLPFDPEVHEAVTFDEGDGDGVETVGDVLRPGYRLGDRVLRAALVQVVMAEAPEESATEQPVDIAGVADESSDAIDAD